MATQKSTKFKNVELDKEGMALVLSYSSEAPGVETTHHKKCVLFPRAWRPFVCQLPILPAPLHALTRPRDPPPPRPPEKSA
jgi:hypothetical protein